MSDTAYVVVMIDQRTMRVTHVGVYSEPAHSLSRMADGLCYATLFAVQGRDFDTARIIAIEKYHTGWLFEGLARRFPIREDG